MDRTTEGPARGARVLLTGTTLTVGELIALADGEAVPAVAPEAREQAVRSWHAAQRLAAAGRLYGRGTGVGAHRSVPVDEDDETAHGLRVLRSHAGGAGAPLPARQVRAMLAIRATQLLAGGSGIHPTFIDALTEALRLGVHPAVDEYGGIGTGDLTALAQTGLTLLGERPWMDGRSAEAAVRGAGRTDGPGAEGADGLWDDRADGWRGDRTEPRPEDDTPDGRDDTDDGLWDGRADRWRDNGRRDDAPDDRRDAATDERRDDGTDVLWDGRADSWRDDRTDPRHPSRAAARPQSPVVATPPGTLPAATALPEGSPVPATPPGGVAALAASAPPSESVFGPVAPPQAPPTGVHPPSLPAPVTLHPGDALALLSSNALALGQAALAQHGLDVLLRATHAVAGLSLVAVAGSAEAYAAEVHAVRPYPGAARAAGEVRRLLGMDKGGFPPGRRIQDPFGFRAFPQAHGCALDACERLREVVEAEVNCASENPLVAPDGSAAHHHGGFFAAPLGLALDGANLALLQTAQLSTARLAALGDPALTGLPAFLAAGPASSSGTMILEYTANSALAELRACTAPASAGHAVLGHGLEEAASFAGQAARQTLRATDAYTTVLACELVTAVRALRMLPVPPPVAAFTVAAAALPVGTEDRPLTGDLATAAELLPVLAGL